MFSAAFRDGIYDDFGDGKYGNLSSMVATIILDPESRSIIVDSDP